MRGDILIIRDEHYRAARQVFALLKDVILDAGGRYIITIAGESGAGKSETALALAETLKQESLPAFIIQQDDFFRYPPKTNAAIRIQTGGRVGPGEVCMDVLNGIVRSARAGIKSITKPLVLFNEDMIITETVDISPFRVILIEGTYTTLLEDADCRIFIDRDIEDTRADRLARNRETQDEFLEMILMREHKIISQHKEKADLVITSGFTVERTSMHHDR